MNLTLFLEVFGIRWEIRCPYFHVVYKSMNHDQNFKNLILDYPRQALAFFAEEEAREIDASARIIPVRQEQLKERLGDRFRELDVPLLVEWPEGRRETILFVLEEESNANRFSIHRLAHYCLDLSELFETDRVVPVVIFLRRGQYERNLVLGGDRHNYLQFHYLVSDLGGKSFEQYRESNNIVARLNLPNMHYPPEQKVEVYAHAVRGLSLLEPQQEKQLKYLDFIDIYAGLNDNELQLYREQYPEEAEKVSNFAERFREEGMQQGEAIVLIRQLTLKFGEIPEETRRYIEAADTDSLIKWLDQILTAQSIDEVMQ